EIDMVVQQVDNKPCFASRAGANAGTVVNSLVPDESRCDSNFKVSHLPLLDKVVSEPAKPGNLPATDACLLLGGEKGWVRFLVSCGAANEGGGAESGDRNK